jgi:hypothetical protein
MGDTPDGPGERRRVRNATLDALADGIRTYLPPVVGELARGFARITLWSVGGLALIGVTAVGVVTLHLPPDTLFQHPPTSLPAPIGRSAPGESKEQWKGAADRFANDLTYIEPVSTKKLTVTLICPPGRVGGVAAGCVYVVRRLATSVRRSSRGVCRRRREGLSALRVRAPAGRSRARDNGTVTIRGGG